MLKRLLARTDITFSNSLIESWWRVLKHQWLYLNTLDTIATLKKLVTFYVEQHNTHLPHSVFRGQTPDEETACGRNRRYDLRNVGRRPKKKAIGHEPMNPLIRTAPNQGVCTSSGANWRRKMQNVLTDCWAVFYKD